MYPNSVLPSIWVSFSVALVGLATTICNCRCLLVRPSVRDLAHSNKCLCHIRCQPYSLVRRDGLTTRASTTHSLEHSPFSLQHLSSKQSELKTHSVTACSMKVEIPEGQSMLIRITSWVLILCALTLGGVTYPNETKNMNTSFYSVIPAGSQVACMAAGTPDVHAWS